MRRIARLLFVVALLAGSAWGLAQLELQKLAAVMRGAPAWMLALGVACNFVNLCGKASSWYFLLPRSLRPPWWRLVHYGVIGGAFSVVAPLRAGEGLRIFLLAERHGVPASVGVGVALTEKILNVLGLVVLVLPLPWLVPGLPSWLGMAAVCCGAGVLGLALAVRFAASVVPLARYPKLYAGCAVVQQQGLQLVPAFACLLLGWLGDCALAALMLQACGLQLTPLVVPFVLFVVNVAIVVPSTPAQVGTLELAAVGALQMLGVDHEQALGFALLYHAVQVLPLLGVVALQAPLLKDAARRMAA